MLTFIIWCFGIYVAAYFGLTALAFAIKVWQDATR